MTLAESVAAAERVLVTEALYPTVVLAAMTLPDGNTLDPLERVKSVTPCGEWVFLTGQGSVPDSVRAMRLGAFDFLTKLLSGE